MLNAEQPGSTAALPTGTALPDHERNWANTGLKVPW